MIQSKIISFDLTFNLLLINFLKRSFPLPGGDEGVGQKTQFSFSDSRFS
jgi:hypothetical protein